MRSGLKNGKLVPPRSLHLAEARYDRLRRKIADVEAQLGDPKRTDPDWRADAALALAAFKNEHRQLRAWIAETLLRRCLAALRAFEKDGVEMSTGELELLERLDKFLSKETEDAGR